MNNISSITSVISSLRAETQEASITPERIGALLQQLANIIANCATDAQLAEIQGGSSEEGVSTNEFNALKNAAIVNIAARVTRNESGATITLTLTEGDDDTTAVNISLPLASSTLAGLISPTDLNTFTSLAAHFVQLGAPNGVWQATANAEEVAATIPYCNDPNKWVLWYYVVGSQYGYIEQSVCGNTCIQLLHWDKKVSQRTITFTDTNRTAISTVSAWSEMKLPTKAAWENLANMVELENMGIRFLGDVGNASSPGEEAAAQLAIASATRIKWIIYKYGSNVGMIHQTHNATTTVQNLYFGGNKHSQRTITFTNNQRTAISSVGSWSSVGTDIGVSRTATNATIKLVHPFMENNAGVLELTIGQANSYYAGLMTKENLSTLNYLNEQVNDMLITMGEMESAISALQDSIPDINTRISNLDNRFVLKAKLYALANPGRIVIPVRNASSNGATIASSVEVEIQLSGLDENENSVDAMNCNITWSLGTNDSIFHVEYEGGKRYVTFIADADDYWPGNTNGKLTITLTDISRNVSGSYEVTLERSASNS